MLIEFYPNPNKPVIALPPPAQNAPWMYSAANGPYNPKSETFKKLGRYTRHYNMTEEDIEPLAVRMNISIDEWVRRDKIVRDLWRESRYSRGQVVYPSEWDEFVEYGDVEIFGLCGSYKDFGNDREWPKDDRPLIHLVRVRKDGQMLNTSKEWLSFTKPVEIIDISEGVKA